MGSVGTGLVGTGLIGTAAVVTGGASGIGKAITAELLRRGANVAVIDINPETSATAEKELGELATSGNVLVWQVGDVASAADVAATFDLANDTFGVVDMLVNNAGTATMSLVVDTSEEEWDLIVGGLLKGTFLATREFGRRLIPTGRGGAIVNISSLNAVAATDGLGHYCAAKAGVMQFTQVCAGEMGRYGIRANSIGPGTTRTPLGEGFLVGQIGQEFADRVLVGPEVRHNEATDIADVAMFLLSEQAQRITGHFIPVDGGQHVRGLHSYWDVAKAQGLVG